MEFRLLGMMIDIRNGCKAGTFACPKEFCQSDPVPEPCNSPRQVDLRCPALFHINSCNFCNSPRAELQLEFLDLVIFRLATFVNYPWSDPMVLSTADEPKSSPAVSTPRAVIPAEVIDTKILDFVAERFQHGQVFE